MQLPLRRLPCRLAFVSLPSSACLLSPLPARSHTTHTRTRSTHAYIRTDAHRCTRSSIRISTPRPRLCSALRREKETTQRATTGPRATLARPRSSLPLSLCSSSALRRTHTHPLTPLPVVQRVEPDQREPAQTVPRFVSPMCCHGRLQSVSASVDSLGLEIQRPSQICRRPAAGCSPRTKQAWQGSPGQSKAERHPGSQGQAPRQLVGEASPATQPVLPTEATQRTHAQTPTHTTQRHTGHTDT